VRVSAAAIGLRPIAAALTCSIIRFPVRPRYAYTHHCDGNMVTERHKKVGSNEADRLK